jgi:hypothetical protein
MMSKTTRRVEITAFRHQRLVISQSDADLSTQQSTTQFDETLVADIRVLVQQLTGDPVIDAATVRAIQQRIEDGDDHEDKTR